jgi:putative FmdB family regulatory protein
MPIFEYSCDDCGTKFEKLVRRSAEADAVRCPSCGQDHLTTEYSTFAARSGGSKGAAAMEDCGAGMCGGGMCQGGMCGMNLN